MSTSASAPVPVVLADKLLQLILDTVTKNPASGPEAAALVTYLEQSVLLPLLAKLRAWAVVELEAGEAAVAKRLWAEAQVVEAQVSAWCVPKQPSK